MKTRRGLVIFFLWRNLTGHNFLFYCWEVILKRIALLGGTRFIGYHLLRSLYSRGHQITIFNRGITQPPIPLPKKVEVIVGNRNSPKDYRKLFSKEYDVVFDLSGYNENHLLPIVRDYQSSIGHYIFCSTSSVYKTTVPGLLDEESPRNFTRNTYGGNKALAEELLLSACANRKWPLTIFRPNGVFGPYDHGQPTHQAWLVFHRLINSLPIPVINEKKSSFNLLYVDDLINGFIQAMNNETSHGNIYGIAGDEALTELDFIKVCGEISSHDPEIHLVEDLGYDGIKYLHPWARGDLVTDTTKVKTDLAFNCTSLKTALSKTYSWLKLHPEHFGRPSYRGQRYVLTRRPIPEYIKMGWRLLDRASCILHLKYYYNGTLARALVFWWFIRKWLRQRVAF
jgi:nucleoside-diphosphate-sugar epimerase